MHSYNNLYDGMLNDEYIRQCCHDAAKEKSTEDYVRTVLDNLDKEVPVIMKMMEEEFFIPDHHEMVIINENTSQKTRRILKPNYKYEQIVHHMVIGQFMPIVMNGLYEFSCGSIPGRGVHYGKRRMRKWINSYDGKKVYVLKMDIHHFFESIDRPILKRMLKKIIRDKKFYRLLCILIEHDRIADTLYFLSNKKKIRVPNEKAKEIATNIAFGNVDGAINIVRSLTSDTDIINGAAEIIKSDEYAGVPLGYYTSQWFGNFYLKRLDHYIKQELGAEHYMRYMDDMVILGPNKKKLHKMRKAISEYLENNLNLELKDDWQVFPLEYIDKNGHRRGRPLDFMGFKFYHNRTTIRKSIIKRSRRKVLRVKAKGKVTWHDAVSIISSSGWYKHTDSYGYFQKYIKPNVNMRQLRRLSSKHSKRENERLEILKQHSQLQASCVLKRMNWDTCRGMFWKQRTFMPDDITRDCHTCKYCRAKYIYTKSQNK